MFAQMFIGVLGLIFAIYGVACFIQPTMLEGIAGIVAVNEVASSELRAMYGGVQLGVGMFYCFAAVLKHHLKSALLLHVVLFAAVVLTRGVGIILDNGAWLPFATNSYNAMALWLFELPVLVVGLVLFIKADRVKPH